MAFCTLTSTIIFAFLQEGKDAAVPGDATTIRNTLTCGFCGQYNTCDSAMRQGSSRAVQVCTSNCPDAPRDGALLPGDVGISVGSIVRNKKNLCTNLPLRCELCPSKKFVWKYHMATHVAEAHGGENGVGGGGTPEFRASFSISDAERTSVTEHLNMLRRAAVQHTQKMRASSAQGQGRDSRRARTSSGGAGSTSSIPSSTTLK